MGYQELLLLCTERVLNQGMCQKDKMKGLQLRQRKSNPKEWRKK